jgi:hypothetical protein
MSKIYQEAMCNIAATWASDSSMGLFSDPCLEPRPCMIEINEYGTRTGIFHICDSDHWLNAIEKAPLLKRAWVVQERVLAPRVLHFAEGKLFWECNQQRACETYPQKMPSFGAPEELIRPDSNWLSMGGKYEMWKSIVGTYSGAQLTKLEDKEAAIYGVIEVLEKKFDDTCVVELWAGSILSQLLWEPNIGDSTPIEHSQRATTWFPTWSCQFPYYILYLLPEHFRQCFRVNVHYVPKINANY